MDLATGLCYISHVVTIGVWLSLVERFVRDEEVARSNRVTPTRLQAKACFFYTITGLMRCSALSGVLIPDIRAYISPAYISRAS